MRKTGLISGAIIALFGISIMFTPLRTYFIIGWIAGCVLLFNGLSLFFNGLAKSTRNTSKAAAGGITILIGIILLVTDLQQVLTQVVIVNLIAGGILLSGIVECIFGYIIVKQNNSSAKPLIFGIISVIIGLSGLIFKQTTVLIIGFIVGYHIFRIGINIFSFARSLDKPDV